MLVLTPACRNELETCARLAKAASSLLMADDDWGAPVAAADDWGAGRPPPPSPRMRARWVDGPLPAGLDDLLKKSGMADMEVPFMSALSGRDLTLKLKLPDGTDCTHLIKPRNGKQQCCGQEHEEHVKDGVVDVVGLAEHLLEIFDPARPDGWRELELRDEDEHILGGKPFKLGELLAPAGSGSSWDLSALDLGVPDTVCTAPNRDTFIGDDGAPDTSDQWVSLPKRVSVIMTLAELKAWAIAGRQMPAFDKTTEQSSNAAGLEYEAHPEREAEDLRHPDDPLGLFADRIGRALALQRSDPQGSVLWPVLHHVHRLGQIGLLKKTGGICPLNHASCEVIGIAWSYGQNLEDETGFYVSFLPARLPRLHNCMQAGGVVLAPVDTCCSDQVPSARARDLTQRVAVQACYPPKADPQHDYAWSTHVGDVSWPVEKVAEALSACCERSYKVYDPIAQRATGQVVLKEISLMEAGKVLSTTNCLQSPSKEAIAAH